MDSYMSSSVDLKDDTHPLNCCCLTIKQIYASAEYMMFLSADNVSSGTRQLNTDVELHRPNIWRLSSSGVSEVLRPAVQPASQGP
jgi:hypothetical protein